jgi:SAM-dependent methyltransferase
VVGVDASEAMLDRARRLVGPAVELIHDSLPDLGVGGRFDAVVCTLDGITYLAPAELGRAFTSFAARLRPDGWLAFDAHTDSMMAFARSHPVVQGEKDGTRFTITSVVDSGVRASDTRIEIAPPDAAPFTEQHRQYFHRDGEIRTGLALAGFEVTAVGDGYSDRPAGESTLSATWIARRRADGGR